MVPTLVVAFTVLCLTYLRRCTRFDAFGVGKWFGGGNAAWEYL